MFDIQEKREPYAFNTNHHIKSTVRSILAFAKKRRLVTDNYATSDYIDFPKRSKKREVKCMDESRFKHVYRACMEHEDIRYATALLTLMLTGCRRGELVGLKWEDVDLENNRISINKSVSRVKKHGVIEKKPKTEQSTRLIEMPATLARQLQKYRQWYFDEKTKMCGRWNDGGYVFINQDTGKRIAPDTILTWVNKITESAGLGHWTAHSMRHTNITIKLMNNVPLLEVSGQAGHSRTQTTTDVYGRYLDTHKNVAPQILDSIVSLPS